MGIGRGWCDAPSAVSPASRTAWAPHSASTARGRGTDEVSRGRTDAYVIIGWCLGCLLGLAVVVLIWGLG